MPQLLNGVELMKIFELYSCQKQVNDLVTQEIINLRVETGTLRQLLEVRDGRGLVVLGRRLPTRFFDVAFDFRWIRAPKIIRPGQPPEQDRLAIGIIAGEELIIDEFSQRLAERRAMDEVLRKAIDIINKPNES